MPPLTFRYASSWFLTLFSTTLQQPLACRMMDCFLVDGVEVIFRIALACLTLGKEELFAMDMEGMLKVKTVFGLVICLLLLGLYDMKTIVPIFNAFSSCTSMQIHCAVKSHIHV